MQTDVSLAGRLTGDGHRLCQRVYFEDTDFSGVVYHARYLHFLERGRTDYVRHLGISHRELAGGAHGEGLAFAVHHMELKFRRPARIDDILEIRTRPGKLSGARLVLEQSIHCGGLTLLDAIVTIVLVNLDGKSRRFPSSVVKLLDQRTPT